MLNLSLAIVHHLAIFALFSVLIVEIALVKRGMNRNTVITVVKVDLWYGILAAMILIVGFSRAVYAAKGWAYYSHNGFFWAKMATFVAIGLLSVPPTLKYLHWKRLPQSPSDDQLDGVRALLWIELGLFALLPIFAAAMARGYGEFPF
jgi:putative membrane protein